MNDKQTAEIEILRAAINAVITELEHPPRLHLSASDIWIKHTLHDALIAADTVQKYGEEK